MQTNVLLPQLELTMESVQVAGWLVKAGDAVAAGQPIIEIETQKSVVEVPCPVAGTVRKLCVAKGDTIGEKGAAVYRHPEPRTRRSMTRRRQPPVRRRRQRRTRARGHPRRPRHRNPSGGIRAAPAARKLAADLGLDLATIKGTGPGGRISLDDVKNDVPLNRQPPGEWHGLPAAMFSPNTGWRAAVPLTTSLPR